MAFMNRVQTIFEWIPPYDDMRILDCAWGAWFLPEYVPACQPVRVGRVERMTRSSARRSVMSGCRGLR
jgi:hypothetical protein